ncbi:MAG: C40 family peptidase [Rhodobiaceae bacterium]|nr:C40 family peptidase [Rhodobiaceae bacterium]MCC0055756.1 C40 family peptidase [Rhodobiaceae bacterium]
MTRCFTRGATIIALGAILLTLAGMPASADPADLVPPSGTGIEKTAKSENSAAKDRSRSAKVAKSGRNKTVANAADPSKPLQPTQQTAAFGASSRLVSVASNYIGGNPTGRSTLWCMAFVKLAMEKAGYKTVNSLHSSAAFKYGPKVSKSSARPGDLIYRHRKGGGHVEIFAGWANAEKTKYVAISGNSCGPHGKRHVCRVTRPISMMQAVIRPETSGA